MRLRSLAGLREQIYDPLHSHREPDSRRRLTAELSDEPIVAAAGAYGILRSKCVGDPLEDRAAVVVQAADQPRVDAIADTDRVERGAERSEVLARLRIQMIGEERRARNDRAHFGILAVQDAQRIAVEAPPAVAVQRALVRLEVADQLLAVDAPRLRRAEGVDLQPYPLDAEPPPEPRREGDQLRIDVGTGKADRFEVELIELPVTALLRPLVAEHG